MLWWGTYEKRKVLLIEVFRESLTKLCHGFPYEMRKNNSYNTYNLHFPNSSNFSLMNLSNFNQCNNFNKLSSSILLL